MDEAIDFVSRVRNAAVRVMERRGLSTLLADEGGLSPGLGTGREALRRSFGAFVDAYFLQARFEPRVGLGSRAASLLPGLILARVDGKSPVEYLTGDRDRELVRKVAVPMILRPPACLAEVLARWLAALAAAT